MIDNYLRFEIRANGDYIIQDGQVRALANYSTILQVVAPMPLETSVMASFLVYDSRNFNYSLFLRPTNKKGRDVSNNLEVANYNVWEIALDDVVLSNISKYRAGRIGVGFTFRERRPSNIAVNYKGTFDSINGLPESSDFGDYYVAKEYNFTDKDLLWTYNDLAVWRDKWVRDRQLLVIASSSTVDVAVDPSLLTYIPQTPQQDIEEIISLWGAAFVETIEMANRVAALEEETVKTITKEDTSSIDITLTRIDNEVEIKANAKLSQQANNSITIENDGLYLRISSEEVNW